MSRPLVLLDVDGVVNAWRVTDPEGVGGEVIKLPRPTGWPSIVLMPETVDALHRIVTSGAEIMWCSSWRSRANRILPPLADRGLVPAGEIWDAITDGGDFATDQGTKWKTGAVLGDSRVIEALLDGRKVYWIEDFGWGSRWWDVPKRVVQVAGIVGIDTWDAGYLTPGDLAGTELV